MKGLGGGVMCDGYDGDGIRGLLGSHCFSEAIPFFTFLLFFGWVLQMVHFHLKDTTEEQRKRAKWDCLTETMTT